MQVVLRNKIKSSMLFYVLNFLSANFLALIASFILSDRHGTRFLETNGEDSGIASLAVLIFVKSN